MKRIELSKRELLLLSIMAAALIVYLYLNFLLLPGYAHVNRLKDELEQKRLIAVNKEAAEKKMSAIDSLLEEEQLKLEFIEKQMPYNVKLPELVVNIDDKIKQTGMEVKSISIGDTDLNNKEYGVIPIGVEVTGKYDDILEFVKYIENNERKFIVDSFALAPIKRNEPMSFNISMRTFVLKDHQGFIKQEPEDYSFFRHNNGKSYPFLENNESDGFSDDGLEAEIEIREKRIQELQDIIDRITEGVVPDIDGAGEDN